MRRLGLFCVILSLLFCSGCWDGQDPEERLYVFSVGVSQQEDGSLLFSFAPAALAEGEEKAIHVTAGSFSQAAKAAERLSSRTPFLGQLKAIVLDESVLRQPKLLAKLLDEAERWGGISSRAVVLAGRNTQACTDALAQEESGFSLWEYFRNGGEGGAELDLELLENTLVACKQTAVLPFLSLTEEEVRVTGAVLLCADGGVVPFDEEAEIGWRLLSGKGEGEIITLDNGFVFSVQQEKTVCKEDLMVLTVKVTLRQAKAGALSDETALQQIQEALSIRIKQLVEHTIETTAAADPDGLWAVLPRQCQGKLPQIQADVEVISTGQVE